MIERGLYRRRSCATSCATSQCSGINRLGCKKKKIKKKKGKERKGKEIPRHLPVQLRHWTVSDVCRIIMNKFFFIVVIFFPSIYASQYLFSVVCVKLHVAYTWRPERPTSPLLLRPRLVGSTVASWILHTMETSQFNNTFFSWLPCNTHHKNGQSMVGLRFLPKSHFRIP